MSAELETIDNEDVPASAPSSAVTDLVTAAAAIERIVDSVHGTKLVTGAIRGHKEECFAIALRGHELGIPIMQALGGDLFVVDGKVGMAAELMRALILRDGHQLTIETNTIDRAVITGTRSDSGSTCTVEFTIDDAARAGLTGTAWRKYPRAMLLARATSELARNAFPDVIRGVSYTPEELESIAPTREIVSAQAVEIDWEELGWTDRAEHDQYRNQVRNILAAQDEDLRARLMRMWKLADLAWPLSRFNLKLFLNAMQVEGLDVPTLEVDDPTNPERLDSSPSEIGSADPIDLVDDPPMLDTEQRSPTGGRARCTQETVAKIEAAAARLGVEGTDIAELASAILGRDINDVAKLTNASAAKVLVNLLDQVQRLDEDEAGS